MRFTSQRRIAAQILKVGENKVRFDPAKLSEIKEAITKSDIRSLINSSVITKRPEKGTSTSRAKKIKLQKRKGRRKGPGSRKGKKRTLHYGKHVWILKVRSQRNFIKLLRSKKVLDKKLFRDLYRKVKGNYFRNKRHIKLYLEEHNLIKK